MGNIPSAVAAKGYQVTSAEKSLEVLQKEIDLIQACIKKYDDRSLLIKGWSIALVGLIAGISSDSIFIFDSKGIPVALSVLLAVNFLFHLMDIENQKKKWQYLQLYNWTLANREFDDQPWQYVYNLDYTRFAHTLKEFRHSSFSKTVYTTLWMFILFLMVWHMLTVLNKPKKEKGSEAGSPASVIKVTEGASKMGLNCWWHAFA